MTLFGLLILLIIAAVTGSLGQALAGYSRGGCLLSIALGFIGAFLGLWIARQLGLPRLFTIEVGGQPFPILWSIIGSALVAAFFGLIGRQQAR